MVERDPDAWSGTARSTEQLMAELEGEHNRLDELGDVWRSGTTTVTAKDRSFTMAFDGRGDLSDITFNGTRYRRLAPAELAHLLLETMRAGRLQSLEKMAATMSDAMPGVDLVGLATGRVDPRAVLDSLVGPLFAGLGGSPAAGRAPTRPDAEA